METGEAAPMQTHPILIGLILTRLIPTRPTTDSPQYQLVLFVIIIIMQYYACY